MKEECVRAAMLGRANVHAHGNSGVRLAVSQTLVEIGWCAGPSLAVAELRVPLPFTGGQN